MKIEKEFAKHMSKYEKYKKFWKENKGVIKDIEDLKCVLDYDVGKKLSDELKEYRALEALKETDPMSYAKLVYKKGVMYRCAPDNVIINTVSKTNFKLLKNGSIEAEYGKGMLFYKGKWAEIIEASTKV
jgi:hypothetical protein